MILWTSTTLANGAVVQHRPLPSLPRVAATCLSVGLQAYQLRQAGFPEEADRLIRNFETATGMAGEENT